MHPVQRIKRLTLAALLALGAGCGDGDGGDLSPTAVANIPPGDAQGSGRSSTYALDVVTTACSGECPDITLVLITVPMCKANKKSGYTLKVTQTGGQLAATIDSGLIVSSVRGGVYKDGRFDMGGVQRKFDDGVELTARFTGSFGGQGGLSGTIRTRGEGEAGGNTVDCRATYSMSGQKK